MFLIKLPSCKKAVLGAANDGSSCSQGSLFGFQSDTPDVLPQSLRHTQGVCFMYIGKDEVDCLLVSVMLPSSDTASSTSRSLAISSEKAGASSCKLLSDGKEDGHATQTAQAPTNVSPGAAAIIADLNDTFYAVCGSAGETSSSSLNSQDHGYNEPGSPTYFLSLIHWLVLNLCGSRRCLTHAGNCSFKTFGTSDKQSSRCHMPPMQQVNHYCTHLEAQEACT